MSSRLINRPAAAVSAEVSRLAALESLGVLDTPPSPVFDGLVRLASIACQTPIALVSLVDEKRQWFKAECGLGVRETPREHAFCAHTIGADEILEVEDALLDSRFVNNPLVTGPPHIRFYAGAPLRDASGHRFGSLCVIDTRPRKLDATQREILEGLAAQVVEQLQRLKERREAEVRGTVLLRTLESIPDAVVTCDEHGILAEFNSTARDWHGVDPRALPPEEWADHFDLYGPGGIDLLATESIPLVRAFRGLPVQGQEIVIRARGQRPRTVLCNARQVLAADGRASGAVCVMYDVTAQRETAGELASERARLASVIDASRDVAIIATDAEGSITIFNSGAEHLLGYQACELVGRESPVIFHLQSEIEARAAELRQLLGEPVEGFDVFVRASREGRVETREWTYVRKDGGQRRVRLSVSPLLGADGTIEGFLGMAVDLTEQLRAEHDARIAAERFSSAFNGAAQGMALVDIDGGIREVNDALCAILGYDCETLRTLNFQQLSHPDDLESGMAERARILASHDASFHVRKRYMHRDGDVVWAHLSLSLVRDGAGKPLHFVAQIQDINRERLAELQRDESDRRLRTIADNAPALIGYFDQDQRFRFVNMTFCDWYAVDSSAVIGRTVEEFRGREVSEAVVPLIARALAGERISVETVVHHARLGPRSCQVTFIPDFGDGQVRGCHVMAYDISDQKALARVMEERALTDELTGLPNRAAWMTELARVIARSGRTGNDVAVLFIDLDQFKAVNDVYGHAAGDCVLETFARQLRSTIRAEDFAARLAGDEFVVLLSDSVNALSAAELLATRIRERTRRGAVFEGRTIEIHPSIGIASRSSGSSDAHELMHLADEAMYRDKQRNRG